MMLSEPLAGAGCIEITESNELQPMDLMVPMKHSLEHELRFPVGINRALRQILGHWHALRRAIGGAGRAKDELLHTGSASRFKQAQAIDDVIMKILSGLGHRLSHEGA